MNKKDFMNVLSKEVTKELSEKIEESFRIEETIVVKMNDQKLHGLCVTKGESRTSPTIYIDEAFDAFCEGESIEYIAKRLACSFEESLEAGPETVKSNKEFDFRDKPLGLRVLDVKRNTEFLKDIPYMDVGNDLVLICDVKLEAHGDGFYSTVVNNSVLELIKKDKAAVFRKALQEAWNTDAPVLQTMSSKLFGAPPVNYLEGEKSVSSDEPMYVLSNETGVHGAAAFFYPDVQEKISAVLSDSYYALPSSTEEFIIVPEKAKIPAAKLAEMVYDINRTQVAPNEVLSDSVFRFDKETGVLMDVSNSWSESNAYN